MDKKQLIKIIDFWQKSAKENALFHRALIDKIDVKSGEIVDIVGPRRSGKSSVLKLLMRSLKEESWLYINNYKINVIPVYEWVLRTLNT